LKFHVDQLKKAARARLAAESDEEEETERIASMTSKSNAQNVNFMHLYGETARKKEQTRLSIAVKQPALSLKQLENLKNEQKLVQYSLSRLCVENGQRQKLLAEAQWTRIEVIKGNVPMFYKVKVEHCPKQLVTLNLKFKEGQFTVPPASDSAPTPKRKTRGTYVDLKVNYDPYVKEPSELTKC
jgi:hypothetical protein